MKYYNKLIKFARSIEYKYAVFEHKPEDLCPCKIHYKNCPYHFDMKDKPKQDTQNKYNVICDAQLRIYCKDKLKISLSRYIDDSHNTQVLFNFYDIQDMLSIKTNANDYWNKMQRKI